MLRSGLTSKIKLFIKKILSRLMRFFKRNVETNTHEWFTGNYSSWDLALKECKGYDAPNILEKVKESLLKVKKGEAVYERDSVVFDHVEYSLPLLSFLLYIASAHDNHLRLLDFGGSLGSSYFQNKKFLDRVNTLEWSIVEQPHFVECGKENFQDEVLKFYHTIQECILERNPKIVVLSSVLPYISEPYGILKSIVSHNFEYIVIDRTPFFTEEYPDRITIETVPPEIYEARYPAWFFNLNRMVGFLSNDYELMESFLGSDTQNLPDANVEYRALLFKRKT